MAILAFGLNIRLICKFPANKRRKLKENQLKTGKQSKSSQEKDKKRG
jgi:hypothetical protein